MKCIHCGRVSRLRERTDGRCPGCRHRFAFDPEARPAAGTDAEFQDAIDRVSGGGRLRFTVRHLWLAVNGESTIPPPPRSSESYMVPLAVVLALPGAVMAMLPDMGGMLIMSFLGGAAGAAMGWGVAETERERYADRIRPRLPFDVFLSGQLRWWREVHGDIPGLLDPGDTDAAAEPPQVPADTAAFDRAVVTDRWGMARMLVANGFHLEHKCAVLSRDGYPAGGADTIKETLRRNPRLTVFALHDASPEGCQLPLDLRAPEWFPDPSVRVVDLGMRPETVMRLKLPWIPGKPVPGWTLPPRLNGLLSYHEQRWLAAGNVYELAALPPAQLMRAVSAGIAAAGPNDGSGLDPEYDGASWASVAGWFGAPADAGAERVELDRYGRRLSGADDGAVDPPPRPSSSYFPYHLLE
jgi:hypothetical protein